MRLSSFAKYVWFVLAFNIGVILWGAYVRATGSGAGCGSHWPLCDGLVIPRAEDIETIVEYTHRLSSGAALLLVLGLLIWALRIFPAGNNVRQAAIFSMAFMITEALVGAGLVLFELVAEDASTARAFSISIHLVNTFLLLASISLTAWWASGGGTVNLRGKGINPWLLAVGALGTLILGMSGALTALGDTLFPVSSLAEGIQQDFSSTAHFLVRLRILHPTIAVITSAYLILSVGWFIWRTADTMQRVLGRLLVITLVVQLFAGLINVVLLAPVWLQLVHLFLADAAWICLIVFSAQTLSSEKVADEGVSDPVSVVPLSSSKP